MDRRNFFKNVFTLQVHEMKINKSIFYKYESFGHDIIQNRIYKI